MDPAPLQDLAPDLNLDHLMSFQTMLLFQCNNLAALGDMWAI